MKLFTKVLSVATIGMLVATTAQAQPYVGAKIGKTTTKADNGESSPMSYGIYGGYNFDGNFGVEADYSKTKESDNDPKASILGLYGTYRMPMPSYENFYLKGKLGYTSVKADVKDAKADSGYTVGVGVGTYFADNVAVEAEYNLSPDINDAKVSQLQLAGKYSF